MPSKHQKNPRPGHNPRKWRQPANGTARHHPRHRDQQAGARATAAALGIMPPVRVPADPQHSDHRRQHLSRLALGRNIGAAAGAGSQSQAGIQGWRKDRSVHLLLPGAGQDESGIEGTTYGNRNSLPAEREPRRLPQTCRERGNGYRDGRRRRPDHGSAEQRGRSRQDRRSSYPPGSGTELESSIRQGGSLMSLTINLTVNGNTQSATAEPSTSLLDFLRDTLNYKGTKLCCNTGECGACTIIYNGKPINSCVTLAADANGAEIVTIEGLADGDKLHPVQQAFIDTGAVQCGY